jgi:3-oxoacyl-[acyl-carrier protein] reductase
MQMTMQIDLSGKVAVVTGASGQLGRVMARTLGKCGADVAVNYLRNQAQAEEIAQEITAMGRRALAVQGDVTSKESVQAMQSKIKEALGDPDIIVTNAVSQYDWVSVLEQAEADYRSQFESCVLHNVLMAQVFVPSMVQKGHGRVIAINTECAMQNFPSQSAYVSGKRGMDGVLRVLAKEVGPSGVTVNQVAPGWMISDRARQAGTERQEGYEKNVPLRRRGDDQDIANAVVWLASDLAGFVTGVYLPVCGGNVMPAI